MEFLLNAEGYSISNILPMSNSTSPYLPPSPFGFQSSGNPKLLDGALQLAQKTKNSVESEGNANPKETQSFMISGTGAQEIPRRHVSASMSTAEATLVTTTELRSPPSAGLGTPPTLAVNGGGTAKAGKKRTRASRKAPTTLLNTDTSNFRAMVQRFTGIPEIPFGYSSMQYPTLSPHVGHHEWGLLSKPLPYKTLLDLNMNCVPHLNSAPDSYCPPHYNGTAFIPLQSLHDYINISNPLNSLPKAPQGQSSNASLLNDVGLFNSASMFPNPPITLSSDKRAAYLI